MRTGALFPGERDRSENWPPKKLQMHEAIRQAVIHLYDVLRQSATFTLAIGVDTIFCRY
jgi:hypothetical protein